MQGMRELGLVEGRILPWIGVRRGTVRASADPRGGAGALKVDVIVAVTTLKRPGRASCVGERSHRDGSRARPDRRGIRDEPVPPRREHHGAVQDRNGGQRKHLELLQAAVPKLSLVAVLINPGNPSDSLILEQIQGIA